jgi:hypothetical protein
LSECEQTKVRLNVQFFIENEIRAGKWKKGKKNSIRNEKLSQIHLNTISLCKEYFLLLHGNRKIK